MKIPEYIFELLMPLYQGSTLGFEVHSPKIRSNDPQDIADLQLLFDLAYRIGTLRDLGFDERHLKPRDRFILNSSVMIPSIHRAQKFLKSLAPSVPVEGKDDTLLSGNVDEMLAFLEAALDLFQTIEKWEEQHRAWFEFLVGKDPEIQEEPLYSFEIRSESQDTSHCSFCGRGRDEVKKMVEGPGARICSECIELSSAICAD